MKLIDYIIANDEGIEAFKKAAEFHEMETEDYIMSGYCPTAFKLLSDTPYAKPYSPQKNDKSTCKYSSCDNDLKCNECWSREVLVLKQVK